MMDDKSKAELNLKSEDATVEMSKNAQLKALISSTQMKFDMYQKTKAVIEGDVINFKLRLDNDADFTGQKLTSKNTDLLTEGFAECSINVAARLVIDAKGKSETRLYGAQKIEVKNLLDSAVLSKKPTK
jgi:flagellar basal body L-ring protein FlgH